jgi:hypothetical protein
MKMAIEHTNKAHACKSHIGMAMHGQKWSLSATHTPLITSNAHTLIPITFITISCPCESNNQSGQNTSNIKHDEIRQEW